jgi:hypothetical protein
MFREQETTGPTAFTNTATNIEAYWWTISGDRLSIATLCNLFSCCIRLEVGQAQDLEATF